MTKRKALLFLGIVIAGVIVLFATSSSALTYNILGLPFGNLLVWFGLISLQLFAFIICNSFKDCKVLFAKLLRLLMLISIITALFWLCIAYFIAGNIQFNFSSNANGFVGSPKASILYWNIIYTLITAPFLIIINYQLLCFYLKLKNKK